jgi:hypothetical protein
VFQKLYDALASSDISCIFFGKANAHLEEKSVVGSFNKLYSRARMSSFLKCISNRTNTFIAKGKISVGFFRDRQNC